MKSSVPTFYYCVNDDPCRIFTNGGIGTEAGGSIFMNKLAINASNADILGKFKRLLTGVVTVYGPAPLTNAEIVSVVPLTLNCKLE